MKVMTRTNIEIDDELVGRVMKRYELKTKKEAVDLALRQLAGTRDPADFRKLRRLTTAMPLVRLDPVCDFTEAAALYKVLRGAGVTIRSMTDCLIAAIAWRREATIVHADADFDRIAARYPV